MRSAAVLSTAFAAGASAHAYWAYTIGNNGVIMPGLQMRDGTPRDCVINACGAQDDTAIMRDAEMSSGKTGPLGRTPTGGNVDPARVVAIFMGMRRNDEAAKPEAAPEAAAEAEPRKERRAGVFNLPVIGVAGLGGKRITGPKETMVGDMAGKGVEKGLPTCDEEGRIKGVVKQVNQDGAGGYTFECDGTSGGYDYKAFKSGKVLQNVPGLGILGLSIATNTEFVVEVQIPDGMVCNGEVAGVKNVCIGRFRNQATAGPFGGSFAFTQSAANKKRAIAYQLKKRFDLDRMIGA